MSTKHELSPRARDLRAAIGLLLMTAMCAYAGIQMQEDARAYKDLNVEPLVAEMADEDVDAQVASMLEDVRSLPDSVNPFEGRDFVEDGETSEHTIPDMKINEEDEHEHEHERAEQAEVVEPFVVGGIDFRKPVRQVLSDELMDVVGSLINNQKVYDLVPLVFEAGTTISEVNEGFGNWKDDIEMGHGIMVMPTVRDGNLDRNNLVFSAHSFSSGFPKFWPLAGEWIRRLNQKGEEAEKSVIGESVYFIQEQEDGKVIMAEFRIQEMRHMERDEFMGAIGQKGEGEDLQVGYMEGWDNQPDMPQDEHGQIVIYVCQYDRFSTTGARVGVVLEFEGVQEFNDENLGIE